jgi:hypothetical protein
MEILWLRYEMEMKKSDLYPSTDVYFLAIHWDVPLSERTTVFGKVWVGGKFFILKSQLLL